MRPKKVILLIDNDQMRRNVLAFVLENTGRYAVIACSTWDLPLGQGDVVLRDVTDTCSGVIVRVEDGEDLCRRLRRSNAEMPVLAIGGDIKTRTSGDVAAWLTDYEAANNRTVLDIVLTLATRKRGPKKHAASIAAPDPMPAQQLIMEATE